jgi:pectin methylesterase-like acyl-CoA thioesterase
MILTALLLAAFPWQAHASTYIVDKAPGATDTGPGTEEKPFLTVQRALDVVKRGDVIVVMAGKYDERVKVRTSGVEGRPITLRATPRRSVVISGFDLLASYVRIEGFEITAEKPAVAVQLSGSHFEVLDNYVHDMMVAVAGTTGTLNPEGTTRDLFGRGAQPDRV